MTDRVAPRAPLSVTCDARLRSSLTSTALVAALPPSSVARTYGIWAALGLAFWFASGALLPFVVVGVLMPTALLGVTLVNTVRAVHAAVPVGSTVTSSYDAEGRIVIARATGERVLPAGWADAVERHGEVTVIRRRARRTAPLVTPTALLTDQDAALLTAAEPADDGLRYSLVVTPSTQKDLAAGYLRMMLRHPLTIPLYVLFAVSAGLVALLPAAYAVRMGLLLVVVAAFIFAVLPRLGIRQLYPVGATVGADVTDEGLVLDVPGLPARVPHPAILDLTRTPHCVVLRRHGSTRRLVLPRDLLPADALERLAQRA